MSLSAAFSYADDILTVAAKGIAEVISVTGVINVDFNDVNTVLRNSGHAIMGSATAEGENRAIEAVKSALTSPLLMDNDIDGARYVLLNITYGSKEVMMDEITEITDYIQEAAGATADVIWGHGLDESLGEKISITLIAAGLKDIPLNGFEKAPERNVVDLHGENNKEIKSPLNSPVNSVDNNSNNQHEFSEEPFLKSEQIIDNTIPDESISNSFGEKKSFDLFESAAVEINPSSILNVKDDTNFVEEITLRENEITSNTEEEESIQPEFSWDLGAVSNSFSELTNTSNSSEEKEEIVRHMLEEEEEVNMELDTEDKRTSPEEQQKLAQERSSRIMEFTSKLKKAEGIAEFENEPAYVRRNISLNESLPSSEESVSRFGLSEDEDGKSGLRSNNFLHDNVD
jgi:cell division protein FtsZ